MAMRTKRCGFFIRSTRSSIPGAAIDRVLGLGKPDPRHLPLCRLDAVDRHTRYLCISGSTRRYYLPGGAQLESGAKTMSRIGCRTAPTGHEFDLDSSTIPGFNRLVPANGNRSPANLLNPGIVLESQSN